MSYSSAEPLIAQPVSPAFPHSTAPFLTRFRDQNWKCSRSKALFLMRVAIILAFLLTAIANSATGMMLPYREIECLEDSTFVATEGINKFLSANPDYRDALLVFASALMDAIMLISAGRFLLLAQTWRPLFCLVAFYVIRGLVMGLFHMKFPEGYLWDYPGFPSLIVPYVRTSDFFFSGHVGFTTITILENYEYGHYHFLALSIFTLFVEAFAMIVTRGHYCIDIIVGVVFAHYIWMLSGYVISPIDQKLVVRSKEAIVDFEAKVNFP